jgi:GalNAc-alpha-(1->4)-GalNAc-alpha-(1->3)-diNAcBac-PP-undecaprenol alpha-1,4-N-acetyl-D-galactosaminyltransferase
MKIAFELDKVQFGGAERVMLTLIREFIKRGIDVVIYTFNKDLDVTKVPARVIKIESTNKFQQIFETAHSLKKEKIDILVLFGLHTICFIACQLSNIKYVYSLRNDPLQVRYNYIKKLIMEKACSIIFQTNKIMNSFPSRLKTHPIVIYNPIMDDSLYDFSHNREKRIVVVARHSEEKNIELAIKAFSNIKRNGYILELYGEGPLTDKYKMMVDELSITKEVVFKGQVNRVIDYIYNADILLLTSNFEGMPNALIEGMSNGLACISTKFPSGAAEELIKDGINGFTIEMNDEVALTEKLQLLVTNGAVRKRIQEEAFKIRKELSRDNIINQWIALLSKIKLEK